MKNYARIYTDAASAVQALGTHGTQTALTKLVSTGQISSHLHGSGAQSASAVATGGSVTIRPPSYEGEGVATVQFHASFTVGTADVYQFTLFQDATAIPGATASITCASASSPSYTVALTAIVNLTSQSTFTIKCGTVTNDACNLTLSYGALQVTLL